MEIPQPPQDEELKNIIDKLAIFVARNGPEFEGMTKQKQQGNARFSFLYGGEFFNYYMYRVTTEQAVLKHKAAMHQRQGQGQGLAGPAPMGMNPMNPGPGPGPGGMGLIQNFGPGPGPNFGGQNPHFGDGGGQGHFPQRFPPPFDPQGPGPRHMSRFDQFDRDRGPQFQPRNPMRMPFQRQPQQNFGNFENFDQGLGPGQQNLQNLGGPGPGNFDFHQNQGPGGGGPSGPGGFDKFDRGPPPQPQGNQGFEPQIQNRRGRFDVRPPGFDNNGPPQGFNANFQQNPNIPPATGNNGQNPPGMSITQINAELESLKTQKQTLEEQISQSELNLTGQNQVLMNKQQQQIDESIRILQDAEIQQLAAELNVDLNELDSVLQPIIDSCTKDSISGGKAWIFTHTSTPRHYQLLSIHLLRKTTDPDASFNKRLHIIYLVNDVLHHCMRKGAEDLQQVLEAMVIPMYCHAKVNEADNPENLVKLDKLLTLWENKSQYVSSIAVDKLRDSTNSWLEYHSELLKRHGVVVTQIAQNIQKTYEGYQAQHQLFCQHSVQNIKTIDQKIQQLTLQQQFHQQQQQLNLRNPPPNLGLGGVGGPPNIQNIPPPGLVIPGGSGQGQGPGPSLGPPGIVTNVSLSGSNVNPTGYPPGTPGFPPNHNKTQNQPNLGNAPPPGPGLDVAVLDISRPPPGFPPPLSEKELMPALPYYELPAGLMVSLVKPEDDTYKPIDPKAIRLPPPCPPSERLLQAVEAFYAAPSHERPRDSEGWERLGLYEYFKSKNLARKQKEDDIQEKRREKSRSPSPIRRDSSPCGRSPPRRRYHSKSPTPSKRRRSRSRSPSRKKRSSRRSRSRSPVRRSPTPPSFGMAGLGMERKIDESNKGHQLLMKMGWAGSGLGANEQGIEAPISGGEIREKKDLYKGVGISMNDPFESYRKTKGQAFVERMRQRAEDRP